MAKGKHIFIGSSPSSGSTMMANLFDAIPGFACGPETRIPSCTPLLKDFDKFKKKVNYRFAYRFEGPGYSRNSIRLNIINESSIGISKKEFVELVKSCDSYEQLVEVFAEKYLKFRQDNRYIWVEKTPENIYNASLLLDKFPESYFLQIIRNPLYVFNSLVTHRNPYFTHYLAAATWFLDASVGYALKEHPRFICIRYEDVVQRPFELMSELVKRFTSEDVEPGVVEARLSENAYRKSSKEIIKSWSVKESGAIKNANEGEVDPTILEAFYGFLDARLNAVLIKDMKLPSMSMRETAEHYGYTFGAGGYKANRGLRTLAQLSFKFLFDFLHGDAALSEFTRYTRPMLI